MRVALGIGSNINRRRHIQEAVNALGRRFGSLTLSPVYRSRAVGFEGPDFFNLVAIVDTGLAVDELHDALRAIEAGQGRTRTAGRFSSRSLDIDILLYGDQVLRGKGHDIPRDEILRYPFVLKPLADLLPDERHPELGETYAALWSRFAANHDVAGMSDCEWTPVLEDDDDEA